MSTNQNNYRAITVKKHIMDVNDVEAFFEDLHIEGLLIHPDGDFNRVLGAEDISPEMKDRLNGTLEDCHRICEEAGADIYEIAEDVRCDLDGEYLPMT